MLIDVSVHNGLIDWSQVKSSGVTGAIIRCGYGRDMTKQDDSRFNYNMSKAIEAGLKVGVYIYSYAKSVDSAKSEAQHVLRLIAPFKDGITLPIYLDLEEAGTESGAIERACVFGDIIEGAGYWCGVYASSYWWRTYLKGLDRFTKWVADWGINDGSPTSKPNISGCDMWQYTSKGRVSGISGNVDLNEQLREDLKGYIGAKPSPAPAPDPEPTPEPSYIEYKIKKGDTLSKIAKSFGTTVKAIKDANPEKIKNVNKIYAGDTIKIPQ